MYSVWSRNVRRVRAECSSSKRENIIHSYRSLNSQKTLISLTKTRQQNRANTIIVLCNRILNIIHSYHSLNLQQNRSQTQFSCFALELLQTGTLLRRDRQNVQNVLQERNLILMREAQNVIRFLQVSTVMVQSVL